MNWTDPIMINMHIQTTVDQVERFRGQILISSSYGTNLRLGGNGRYFKGAAGTHASARKGKRNFSGTLLRKRSIRNFRTAVSKDSMRARLWPACIRNSARGRRTSSKSANAVCSWASVGTLPSLVNSFRWLARYTADSMAELPPCPLKG